MRSFTDRAMIVTGASSGIGRALATELARERPRLALAARDTQRLEATAAACRARGAETLIVPTDVTREEDCRHLVAQTIERFGALDVLVNNAGAAMWSRFDELPDVQILEHLMRVNYLGSVMCTQAALPHLRQRRGLIVAMASISGLIGVPLLSGYAASKHAVIGFYESLRIELANSGVGVTIIAPDFVQSEILERAVDSQGQPIESSPLDQSRLLSAEKCAAKIVRAMRRRKRLLLTSERSAWARWGMLLAPRLVDRFTAQSVGWRG